MPKIQVRAHQCFECGHLWAVEVELSKNTTNLSGEKTQWCPHCGSKNGVSAPVTHIKVPSDEKTKHSHRVVAAPQQDCPRCEAVYGVLHRYGVFGYKQLCSGDSVFQLAEHVVDLEEAAIKKVEFNADNFVKCIQAKYRAYLLDDALLEGVLKTNTYGGEHNLEVYLDGFLCEKKENNVVVKDVGGPFYTVPGVSDFPAKAARVGFRCPEDSNKGWVETFFDGHLHLAWFVDDKLKWVVKNLIVTDRLEEWCGGVFYLVNPRFMGTAIIDRRDTCLEGEQGKRVAGWSMPGLLVGESTDESQTT